MCECLRVCERVCARVCVWVCARLYDGVYVSLPLEVEVANRLVSALRKTGREAEHEAVSGFRVSGSF